MSSVIVGLRSTTKGQLKYSPRLNKLKLKHELEQLSPPPLSRLHEEKELSKLNLSFGLDAADFESSPTAVKDFTDNNCLSRTEEKSDVSKDDILDFASLITGSGDCKTSQSRSSTLCPISPEFGYTSCAIVDEEKKWDHMTQLALSKRQTEFEHHNRTLGYLMENKEKEIHARLTQQADHRQILIDRKLQEGMEEGNKRLRRLKEDHEEHQKKIHIRQKEIELKRELLKEAERRRKETIAKLHSLWKDVESNRAAFIQQHDGCKNKSKLPDLVNKYRAVLEKVCSSLAAQVAENLPDIDHLVAKFEENKQQSSQALTFLHKQIEETEQRIRLEEDKQREVEKKKAEDAANIKKQEQAIAQDLSVQALAFIMVDSEKKSRLLAETEALIKPFIDNVKNKKFRFNIQRVVNTPINAISDFSGAHLIDKIRKLKDLFSGQKLKEILHEHNTSERGNILPSSVAEDALLFCQNLVAKMLVKKGEEQVTSKHESAFPIGIVVVALWVEFPVMGELFQAHLQALCPYVLPKYSAQHRGQSSIDYHKSLGYKVSEGGVIEEQDKFLRRMSGLMRLYCACIVAPLPPDVNTAHPHGLEHAWMWLARTMNLEPHPDVTAAMIFDLLSVTGHFLFKEYRVQFAKLLHLLYRSYLPKLESVSVTSGTIGRLKIFLETAMQNSSIPAPDGLLLKDFFFKPPDPDPRTTF
ncbi:hypothetical protein BsWGS_08526 [Bradybaena similaris]